MGVPVSAVKFWTRRWAWILCWGIVLAPDRIPGAPEDGPRDGRVTFRFDVRGDRLVPLPGGDPVREAIALEARFEFEERPAEAAPGVAARRYTTAAASLQAGGQTARRALGEDAGQVFVAVQGSRVTPFLADGFLARDEADLLDTPFEPALADGIRPGEAVPEGAIWQVPGELVAGLAAIDRVETGGIEVSLENVADGIARLRLTGTVAGLVDGGPTRLLVKGTARAAATPAQPDGWRIDGRVTDLDVTMTERREPGWSSPGLDVEARVTMLRRSAAEPSAPSIRPAEGLGRPPVDRPRGCGRPGLVWHRHRLGRYVLVVDSRWRVVEDGPEGLVMRFVDRGTMVAQCSILPLPRAAADAPPRPETVAADVRRSLGDQSVQIAEAGQVVRDDGSRLIRVVADGAAAGRPIRWIHHLVTGPGGHQAAATFVLEQDMLERFAAIDQELVTSLVVLPDAPPRSAAAADGGERR